MNKETDKWQKYEVSAKSQKATSTIQTEKKKLFIYVQYYWPKLPVPESNGATICEGTIHLYVQVSSKLATEDMISSVYGCIIFR